MLTIPSASTRTARRFESLDDWRGLACVFVIIYHSTIVFGSLHDTHVDEGVAGSVVAFTHLLNVGVALFFVISGYCIAAAADNNRLRNGRVWTYFRRRFRRIYPPFWLAVVASIGLFFLFDYGWSDPLLSTAPWAQLRPWWYSPSQWLGNLTLTETWRGHVFGSPRGHFPGQAWTLCYEEQFYFVTGMLLLCARTRFFQALAAVTALTAAIALGCAWWGIGVDGFFFDGSWLMFAAGVAAYYRIQYATPAAGRVLSALLVGAALVNWFVPVPVYGSTVGFVFAAALPWLHRLDAHIASWRMRPLLFCGRMCYSLYLVHQIPVKGLTMALYRAGLTTAAGTLFVAVPLSVLLSVALGWVFYQLVERRFLNTPSSVVADRAVHRTPALAGSAV